MVRTKAASLTPGGALLIKLMALYFGLGYRLTHLEVQKLAYFLQQTGEPLRFNYEVGPYGPYSTNLDKVLELMEGHFTRAYGDSPQPDRDIELIPGAVEQATAFLNKHPESQGRIGRVSELIEGFETPYGMELLSSVHWVAWHAETPVRDADAAIAAIHGWSERKCRMFKPPHIRIAWDRLRELGWLPG
jgi:hypothetical protein